MNPVLIEKVIDQTYLPFTEQQLAEHFTDNPDDHIAYYLASAKRARDLITNPPAGTPAEIAHAIKLGRQMEKTNGSGWRPL
jgi:hypothetical protein